MHEKKIEYNNYYTLMQYDNEDKIHYGKLEGIRDLVSFHGDNEEEFEKCFHEAVDDYLVFCEEIGKEPEMPER